MDNGWIPSVYRCGTNYLLGVVRNAISYSDIGLQVDEPPQCTLLEEGFPDTYDYPHITFHSLTRE